MAILNAGVDIFLICVLSCFSALFSGLTLGLMSLDKVQLQILIDVGKQDKADLNAKRQAWYARRILPVRRDGNLLLCTLLLGNVAVNSCLSILMAEQGFILGLVLSTTVIVLFGEIAPQAACSRYGLAVGAYTVWIVWIFVFLMYPIAKPIALLLDWILGEEMGSVLNRKQLKALLAHHEKQAHVITSNEAQILEGALDFSGRSVKEAMTPIDRVFGVDVNDTLNFDLASAILESGFSRIPVFDRTKPCCIVGLLLVKDMAIIDPASEVPIVNVIHLFGREIYAVDSDTSLLNLLTDFKKGKTHLAVVREVVTETDGDPYWVHVGIITLEDIIEEIIQDEIKDEHDAEVEDDKESEGGGGIHKGGSTESLDSTHKGGGQHVALPIDKGLKRRSLSSSSLAAYKFVQQHAAGAPVSGGEMDRYSMMLVGRLKLFDRKRGIQPLSEPEALAVASFLSATQLPFSATAGYIHGHVLDQLVKKLLVIKPPKGTVLYQKGEKSDTAYLILQGKVKVQVGRDAFECVLGPWCTLGMRALKPPQLVTDTTAASSSSVVPQPPPSSPSHPPFDPSGHRSNISDPQISLHTPHTPHPHTDASLSPPMPAAMPDKDRARMRLFGGFRKDQQQQQHGTVPASPPMQRAVTALKASNKVIQVSADKSVELSGWEVTFVPDFTAVTVDDGARLLVIRRSDYLHAFKATLLNTPMGVSLPPSPAHTPVNVASSPTTMTVLPEGQVMAPPPPPQPSNHHSHPEEQVDEPEGDRDVVGEVNIHIPDELHEEDLGLS
ncbi:unnamed protein product [Vitrella brassicaformis CCMP3155]|uniref:CNNM transmembrane domain-containing protein n=2 Tax=Vitrella brassicaformis TaxID=1169539 RepID=A0A0G4EPX3_VITBC|nr:unnamed protein product [Vitrella brassicaformis CCMP3155]|mmetsp:Transcript_43072/g.122039  ORF Transcript_43072/g.122039 Transcript_43072/m.122039 type:complete len:780 (+) Transcript_43072:111-2450(+)|eukprot:CEL99643.1 unnamed protein product [Vitrella brassicaformis CCMP3155]